MKKIGLNISERLFALQILNAFKGDLDKLAVVLDDIKQFSITAEDWSNADRKIEKSDDGTEQWTWSDENGGEKEIELQEGTAAYLVEQIEKKNKSGELTLRDRAVITLKKKLL